MGGQNILKKFFWPYPVACGISVSYPGIEPTPPALEAWSLNHWTPREVPEYNLLLPPLSTVICNSGQNILVTYHALSP